MLQKSFFTSVLLFLTVLLFSGCQKSTEPLTKSGFYFDTIIQITIYDSKLEDLLENCFEMAERYEKLFSKTKKESDIFQINHAKGKPVTVDEETITLLNTALSYCEQSQGGFDITIGALSDLWDFKNNPGTVPSQSAIDAAKDTVDYRQISINGNEVTISNPDTQIDLGAIAKGYIADKMKNYLNTNGVMEGFINLGGNVLALGPKVDGSTYTIGIQKPFSEDGNPIASVEITNQTVVSSGVYERCFEVEGTLYHHILNPQTGYPYDNDLLSVTIICPASIDGDGLSTTCFSLGLSAGMALIESFPNTEAVFITVDEELHSSSGIGETIPFQMMEDEQP